MIEASLTLSEAELLPINFLTLTVLEPYYLVRVSKINFLLDHLACIGS